MYQGPLHKHTIVEYLPRNPIIVEAGAHIGRDTVKLAKLWPAATIYAFEPVTDIYQQLIKNTYGYSNIHCHNIALSNHTGTELLYVSTEASTAVSSFFKPLEYAQMRPNVVFTPEEVATITLDQWAQEHYISLVDFMWLDMQGAELKVLKASPSIVKTVGVIVLEVSLTERFKDNPLYDEVKSWIESQGFEVVQQDIPKHNKVNLLCVREEFS